MRWFLLLAAFLSLSLSAVSAAAQTATPRINPLTGKPYSAASQAEYERRQRENEELSRMADEATAQDNKAFEELRARNAEQIRQFDEAIETWKDTNTPPAGTVETFVSTSYDNETALGERAEITFYNKYDVPTHKVQFGPDGKPTGPVTLTQQGKVWETIGPRIPPSGGVETSYGEDFEGNRIITRARIFTAGGKGIGDYQFNFEGVPWWGETKDPETGLRNGGFMDERLKPPEATVGGPLPFPSQIRLITGVCEPCRALMEKHNSLALDINEIIIELKALSQEHQHAWPPAQRPIKARHAVLSARLAELMPEMEALQAEVIACDKQCRPAAQDPPPTAAALPGQPVLRPPAGIGARPTAPEKTYRPGQDALPADDGDLRAVTDAAQRYLAAAELCETMLCPVCDCEEAKASAQALADMEAYLEAMLPYLRAANEDHMARFTTTAANNITNGEQVARTTWAIGVHGTLQSFGSSLLDVASIAGWLRDILTSEKSLDELSPVELLDQLNSAYEALKDLESLTVTLAEAQTGRPQNTPVADLVDFTGGVDKDTINDATSYISDLKDIVTNALEHGRDWRAALKQGAAAAGGQIIGRLLKSYSGKVLEEREKALENLLNNAAVGDLQQAREFLELQRVQNRRWAAEDALAAVRAARRRYMACVHEACGTFSLTRANIPVFQADVPGGKPKLSWGKALPWFNRMIDETLPLMKPVVFRRECPEETAEPPRTQPPPQSEPEDDGPDLSRPDFAPVSEIAVPRQFCSEFARNDFLGDIYNPAVQAALQNATLAQNHLAMLNALFTQHMRTNSLYWARVRAERDAYEAIATAATAKAEALRLMYGDIIAVPVVPCDDQPLPLSPPPSTPPLQADPVPPPFVPPPPPKSPPFQPFYDGPAFPYFEEIKPRATYCSRAEVEADLAKMRAQLAEVREQREAFEIFAATAMGNRVGAPADLERGDRSKLQDFYNTLPDDMSQGEKEVRGRIFLVFDASGVRLFDHYSRLINNLEASIRQLEGILERGQYDCPDDAAVPPKKPCPPKQGRDPIVVGPNSRVGSGAQLRSKVGGMALGALAGALGAGGGGGGGGSDGPQLWTCKIKDSEYTIFNDPVTGVSLGVAARTVKGGKMVLFSKIMKSPDKGTFQTAFLERPSTGQTIAPSDVGPCDLWGEWKLTVSWTKTTYVNGQVVDRQSGGWSEGGLFRIPGMLSKVDAPDGLWKRMGFSNASNGAREIGAIFDVQPGGEPLTLVVHVTRPKGDPVTTVPFVLTLTQGPDGKIAVTKAEEEPCPEEKAGSAVSTQPAPGSGGGVLSAPGAIMATPAPTGPPPAPATPGPGAGTGSGPGKPPSTANDDLFLPKREVTYFRPKGPDGPKFADYSQIAEALEARQPCTKEEAQRLLKEVEEALAAQTEAIDDLTVSAGASQAQSGGDLYGPDRPTGRAPSVEDGSEASGNAFDAEAVRVRVAMGDEGESAFRRMDNARSKLRRLKRNLEMSIEANAFDDCPGVTPPPPPPPPPPPVEVMPTPTAGPGDLPHPGPDMTTPEPAGPTPAPTVPGPDAKAGSAPGKPRSTANDDLFVPKPEVTYLQPKGPDGPRFANYYSVAEALQRRAPCTKAEAESLLREVESALSAQAEAVDELGVYAGASGAQPGEGWWRKSSPGTSVADGSKATVAQFELEAKRIGDATGSEGYMAFHRMTDALGMLQGLKINLQAEIARSEFDKCPGVAPPPGEVTPNPTAGPGDLPPPGAVMTPPAPTGPTPAPAAPGPSAAGGAGATTTHPTPQPVLPPWGVGPKPYDPSTDPDFGKLHTAGLQHLLKGLEQVRGENLEQRRGLERARCEGAEAWEQKRAAYLKRLRGQLDVMTRITGLGKDKAAIDSAAAGEVVRLGDEISTVEGMSAPAAPQSCPVTPAPEESESILDEIEEVFVPA
jgi:hypothetical protein